VKTPSKARCGVPVTRPKELSVIAARGGEWHKSSHRATSLSRSLARGSHASARRCWCRPSLRPVCVPRARSDATMAAHSSRAVGVDGPCRSAKLMRSRSTRCALGAARGGTPTRNSPLAAPLPVTNSPSIALSLLHWYRLATWRTFSRDRARGFEVVLADDTHLPGVCS
jgi:hypothetical protein